MDLQLSDKTALVTGASQGIGRAIAKALAAEGVQTCIAARRKHLLDELAAEITVAGGKTPHIIVIDITEPDAPTILAQAAEKAMGKIDILINSAGGSKGHIHVDTPDSAWDESMTLNFVRVRQLTHAALPGMMQRKWGRIINISGKSEPEHMIAATPTKAAIHAWSKGLSREIGPHGVNVNCIQPGRIISEQILRKYSPEFRAEQSRTQIPLGRYGEPEELAALAVFFCSAAGNNVRGVAWNMDGGWVAQ